MSKLRQWRTGRRLTLEQAGALIGVTGPAWRDWEIGRRMPSPANLKAIHEATEGAIDANDVFLPPAAADAARKEAA